MATIVCPDHRPQMATVRPGVFEKLPLGENDATVENVEIKFNSNDIRTKIVEIIKEHKDIVDISESCIPAACWIAPDIQQATYIFGLTVFPVCPTW